MSVKILTTETTGQGAVSTVAKVNGGFGQDVSTGLTNDQVGIVAGNTITIGALTTTAVPNLDTSKITTGTFAIGRIPTGTSSSTLTIGNDSRLPPTPTAAGKLLYDTGSAYAESAAGTSGQILVSSGAGAPTWGRRGGAVISFTLNTAQSFVASGYLGLAGDGSSTVNVNVTPWVVPAAGTLSNLRVFGFSNTSGLTHIVIYKATSALSPSYSATTLDASVSGGTFSGNDTTNTVSVNAGDLIVAFSSASWSANGACVNVMYTPT